ncbi:MAG: dolichyl-phosphate beta-glucosyltransferase [bacterium]
MNEEIYLSVVIPVYNEGDKIEKTLDTIIKYLDGKKYTYEIIVVDDGSLDKTPGIIEEISKGNSKIKLLKNELNQGKGYSLKRGILATRGKYVLFTDCDLSTPFEEIDKILAFLEKDYDIAIGSRKLKDSFIEVHQPWWREFMGSVFYFFAHLLIIKEVSDFNCGFKGYRGNVAHHLYGKGRLKRWGFDVEIIFLTKKFKYKMKEVPVRWINAKTTKVNLLLDSIRSFTELIQIRLNEIIGLYKSE